MKPDPNITVDNWAPKRFNLPASSKMRGLIDLSYSPHIKEILYELSPQSPTKEIFFVCSTQVAKSTANLILIAYRIDCNISGPILAMHAIENLALTWAKDELQETIEANDYIKSVLMEAGRKNDPYLFKKWPGGALITRGGASGSSFAKISASVVLMDDMDRFKMNIGKTTGKNAKAGEGSPIKLLLDRLTGRFGDYKFFGNSSPKSEDESLIWPAFKKTDQNHFYVPCPKCGHFMIWEFENLKFPHENYMLIEEPYIQCENTDCNNRIYEKDKYKALNKAEYRQTAQGIDPLVKGYRINALYSMLGYSFTQYANDWLSASKLYDETGDESEKIRHRNTKQAKPWKKKIGKRIEHSALYLSRENLNPLPENCVILCAGVDIQDDRIELQVKGYGEKETYFIDHVRFAGDPIIKFNQDGSPFDLLHEFIIGKKYENVYQKEQPILYIAIDIGFQKDNVKDYIKRANLEYYQQIFAVYGRGISKTAISFIPATSTKDFDGFESYGLYVNIKKKEFYNNLNAKIKGINNIHFSDRPCFTEKWFQQLTIERENKHGIFEKPHDHARNEALDCSNYADSAYILGKGNSENYDFEDFRIFNGKNNQITTRKRNIVVNEGLKA